MDEKTAECEAWLEGLAESTNSASELLHASTVDFESLQNAFDRLSVDLEEVENCRSTLAAHSAKGKKQPYDFTLSIPIIMRAKRLVPTIKRKLAELGRPTFEPEHKAPKSTNECTRRIPELEIASFSGDITLYSSFITSFQLKFDDLPIPKREKLQHLKKLLQGEPLKIIQTLDLTDENYDRALKELEMQYQDNEEVISALYAKLESLPKANNSNTSLRATYYEVEGLITALESHGQNLNAFPPLKEKVYFKYPAWLVHQVCGKSKPKIKEFQKEIGMHLKLRCGLQASSEAHGVPTITKQYATTAALVTSSSRTHVSTTDKVKSPPNCVFCNQKHFSAECTIYQTVAARRAQIKDRCHICLSKYHSKPQCDKNVTCYYCKLVKNHHSSLCLRRFDKETTHMPPLTGKATGEPAAHTNNKLENAPKKNTSTETNSTRTVTFLQKHKGAHCTILVTAINPNTNRRYKIRALLDNGSNETYITEQAAKRLGLQLSDFRSEPVTVFYLEQPVTLRTASTSFIISNERDFRINVAADTTPNIPQNVQLFDNEVFKSLYPEFADKKFAPQGHTQQIELLIGSDYFYDLLLNEEKITITEGLHLLKLPFGWILGGRQNENITSSKTVLFLSPAQAIATMCNLESIGIREVPLSEIAEEEKALDQFYENINFVNKRYEIRWPWRQFPPNLQDNFGLAIGRLRTQQRKLNDELFNEYNSIIEKQLEVGIAEEVSSENRAPDHVHYLPHHAIITPEKSTSVRLVYDGSAKPTKAGKSINDLMYKGRNLLANICTIILRFRLHKVVIISDIEKAFHQLSINPADRDFVRFLWIRDFRRPPAGKNLRILRFSRIVFGIIASPFILNATIRFHLQKYEKKYAEITKKILNDIYVDNIITGFTHNEAALEFFHTATSIFQDCSMNLRAWATNDSQLREQLKSQQYNASKNISILGIMWDQYEDNLHIKSIQLHQENTLRSVVATVASFFDPCGWWAPVSAAAKIFIHELHLAKYEWDDHLSEEHQSKWLEIWSELKQATETELPRLQIEENNDAEYQLHTFSDASKNAYACATYIRQQNNEGMKAFLVMAKTKIAPQHNIPKLELYGVVLAARTALFIRETLQLSFGKQIIWTDSKCVLHWIINNKILPAYIQRRIDFLRNIPGLEFRYVPTKENPADLPSRGTTISQMNEYFWFHGPVWLQRSQENWPPIFVTTSVNDLKTLSALTLERMSTKTVTVIVPERKYPFDIDITRYRSYLKVLRITYFILKFLSNFQVIKRRKIIPEQSNLHMAQTLWLKAEQNNHYPELMHGNRKHDLVRKFNITRENGLLRCNGRLKHAPLSLEQKSLILLPPVKESYFTQLLILHHHEKNFHAGTSYTLQSIRNMFWIRCGRRSVYHTIKKCVKCKRYKARPYAQPQPVESYLPPFRLDQNIPFSNIGIDIFGHLWVNKEKRYVLLVTDLVIRAVDLELLTNMTSEEIFLALRRVIARRTVPLLVLSDNAPQFKAVEQALLNIYTHNWSWKFLPEHSPWMGGAYERLVGLAKTALRQTFHGVALNDNQLRTILAEIAAILNTRPLTYVTSDAEELASILTPNHFLKSYFKEEKEDFRPNESTNLLTPTANHVIKLWKQSNELNNKFWAVWKTAYLQYLREIQARYQSSFPKHTTTQKPEVGDIVLIAEPLIKRGQWKLGKIIKLNLSEDNQVRSVVLKTEQGNIVRPVMGIYPLEIKQESYDNDEWDDPIITVEEVDYDSES